MSEADQAYEAALKEIARVKAAGEVELWLSGSKFFALDRFPPELAEFANLQALDLTNTQVSDLTPLEGLKNLQRIMLGSTAVSDLTPLQGMANIRRLDINNTQISDLAMLQGMIMLQVLTLNGTLVDDLTPLQGVTSLVSLTLTGTLVSNLTPLQGMKNLQRIELDSTPVSDLTPLQEITQLRRIDLSYTEVNDLRPIAKLHQRASHDELERLAFRNTAATNSDACLAELANIADNQKRTRETLAYLRSLPPWPEPYTPAATPDGSPPQPIGGASIEAQAQALSDLTPLAEELVQDPETGLFSVQYKPIEKPDLLAATLGQVGDAIEDVLQDPSNGLNEKSLDIRKLKRTLERYANDPQRVEMDFTTVHQSLTRQIASEGLPPSDENIALLSALEEGALGIRATDPAVAINRRILQEQKLRELPPDTIEKIRHAAPVLQAITEGDLNEQMREDVAFLTEELPAALPRLPGVTREDAIIGGRDEMVRVFGRASRIVIALRTSPALVRKLHASAGFKAAEIMVALAALIGLGLRLF